MHAQRSDGRVPNSSRIAFTVLVKTLATVPRQPECATAIARWTGSYIRMGTQSAKRSISGMPRRSVIKPSTP